MSFIFTVLHLEHRKITGLRKSVCCSKGKEALGDLIDLLTKELYLFRGGLDCSSYAQEERSGESKALLNAEEWSFIFSVMHFRAWA